MARIVLVADDSPTIQKRAVAILKGEGFDVETVSNGVAAIKRLAALHPVAVLADVSMPGRDGYEVCEFIKKSQSLSRVPVLLVASEMEPYDHVRGTKVGADGIVKKPFEPEDLISTVARFAARFEANAMISSPATTLTGTEVTRQFRAFGEEADYSPTLVQHGAPEFTLAPEGVALTEPVTEESPDGTAPGAMDSTMAGPPRIDAAAPEASAHEEFTFDHVPGVMGTTLTGLPLQDVASYLEPVHETPSSPLSPFEPEFAAPASEAAGPAGEQAATFAEETAAPIPAAIEPATQEPVYIADQPSEPYSARRESTTMIFRTPAELAEPVWKEEAGSSAPEAATAFFEPGELAEPMAGAETFDEPAWKEETATAAPEATTSTFEPGELAEPIAQSEGIAEPVWKEEAAPSFPQASTSSLEPGEAVEAGASAELAEAPAPVSAEGHEPVAPINSLDSFSLDEAAKGQVHFASEVGEVALGEGAQLDSGEPAPVEEVTLADASPIFGVDAAPVSAEHAKEPELAPVETPAAEPAVESRAAEGAPAEAGTHAETSPIHIDTEGPLAATPSDTLRLDAHFFESALGSLHTEEPAVDLHAVAAESAPAEPVSEVEHAEGAPAETGHEIPSLESGLAENVHPEAAAAEKSPVQVPAGIVPPGSTIEPPEREGVSLESGLEPAVAPRAELESVPEVIEKVGVACDDRLESVVLGSEFPAMAPAVAAPEPAPVEAAQAPAPAANIDLDLIHAIVQKVVAKMAPPPLAAEAVEELARRLGEEVAAEIRSEVTRRAA